MRPECLAAAGGDAGMAGDGFGDQGRDIGPAVPAIRQEIEQDDDLARTLGDERVDHLADAGLGDLHVRRGDEIAGHQGPHPRRHGG